MQNGTATSNSVHDLSSGVYRQTTTTGTYRARHLQLAQQINCAVANSAKIIPTHVTASRSMPLQIERAYHVDGRRAPPPSPPLDPDWRGVYERPYTPPEKRYNVATFGQRPRSVHVTYDAHPRLVYSHLFVQNQRLD